MHMRGGSLGICLWLRLQLHLHHNPPLLQICQGTYSLHHRDVDGLPSNSVGQAAHVVASMALHGKHLSAVAVLRRLLMAHVRLPVLIMLHHVVLVLRMVMVLMLHHVLVLVLLKLLLRQLLLVLQVLQRVRIVSSSIALKTGKI